MLRRRPAHAPRAHVRAQPGPGARRAQEVGEVRDDRVDDRVARASDVSSLFVGVPKSNPTPARSHHRLGVRLTIASPEPHFAVKTPPSVVPSRRGQAPPDVDSRVSPPLGLRHRGFGQVSRQGWLPRGRRQDAMDVRGHVERRRHDEIRRHPPSHANMRQLQTQTRPRRGCHRPHAGKLPPSSSSSSVPDDVFLAPMPDPAAAALAAARDGAGPPGSVVVERFGVKRSLAWELATRRVREAERAKASEKLRAAHAADVARDVVLEVELHPGRRARGSPTGVPRAVHPRRDGGRGWNSETHGAPRGDLRSDGRDARLG